MPDLDSVVREGNCLLMLFLLCVALQRYNLNCMSLLLDYKFGYLSVPLSKKEYILSEITMYSKGLVSREIMGGTQARREGPKPATPGLRAQIR